MSKSRNREKTIKLTKIEIPNNKGEYMRLGMKEVKPKSVNQQKYLDLMKSKKMVWALGGSGCGKTCLAVQYGFQELMKENYSKMVVIRAALEASGESLGFLPGDSLSKLLPYAQPIFGELLSYGVTQQQINELINNGKLQILPIAFCRGINLHNSFIHVTEIQNLIYEQLLLVISRFGRKSRIILEGDLEQSDLPIEKRFDLMNLINKLLVLPDVGLVEFDVKIDCVREILVSEICSIIGRNL